MFLAEASWMYYDTLGIRFHFIVRAPESSNRPASNESPKRVFKMRISGCGATRPGLREALTVLERENFPFIYRSRVVHGCNGPATTLATQDLCLTLTGSLALPL